MTPETHWLPSRDATVAYCGAKGEGLIVTRIQTLVTCKRCLMKGKIEMAGASAVRIGKRETQ
jgi:hypothetical protein